MPPSPWALKRMKTWNPGGLRTYRSQGPSPGLAAGRNQGRGEEPGGQSDSRAVKPPHPKTRARSGLQECSWFPATVWAGRSGASRQVIRFVPQARRAEEGGSATETTRETATDAAELLEGSRGRGCPPEGESRSCCADLCLHLCLAPLLCSSDGRDSAQTRAGLRGPHRSPTYFPYSGFFN